MQMLGSRCPPLMGLAWYLPSDRIRRGGPLVVSFLFKPDSIC
jgi:hypothetical protein